MCSGGGTDKRLERPVGVHSLGKRPASVEQDLLELHAVRTERGLPMWVSVKDATGLLRRVSPNPSFRWLDSAIPGGDELDVPLAESEELPAIYCRRCGLSGWMALLCAWNLLCARVLVVASLPSSLCFCSYLPAF